MLTGGAGVLFKDAAAGVVVEPFCLVKTSSMELT